MPSALNDRLRASRTHTPPTAEVFGGAGGEIVHARRKRRGYVNPLVPGSSPGGPTNNRMTTVVTAIG